MTAKLFRTIPKLDIKGPNLVKDIHIASLYDRNSLNNLINKTAWKLRRTVNLDGPDD